MNAKAAQGERGAIERGEGVSAHCLVGRSPTCTLRLDAPPVKDRTAPTFTGSAAGACTAAAPIPSAQTTPTMILKKRMDLLSP